MFLLATHLGDGPRWTPGTAAERAVLYVHGATFPSALSIAHRFDGRSWRDALCDAGFSVWGLDFYGFGYSDRYPEMSQREDMNLPLGLAAESTDQLAAAVKFILTREGRGALSMISHSWGSMPAGRFAGAHPALVDRWVLFAPIARREPSRNGPTPSGPAWRMISAEDQGKRFVEDVPAHEPPVLLRRHFEDWAQRYLATDPDSAKSSPPAVKTPAGPFVEILRAWHGELAYDPGLVHAPVAIVRGAWDNLVTDADARRLFDAFSRSTVKRDTKISRATHLMHLETMRTALWRASIDFLLGGEEANIIRSRHIGPIQVHSIHTLGLEPEYILRHVLRHADIRYQVQPYCKPRPVQDEMYLHEQAKITSSIVVVTSPLIL